MPVAAYPRRSAAAARRRQGPAGRAGTAAGRQRPSRAPETEGTRARLVTAAAAEFAAHGFAGANVDRIARAARVNKAMIYYHFRSKADLYREILGDMFRAVCSRVRVVAHADTSPDEKIHGFIDAIAAEARARPHFPPTWFREVAEGGRHLDERTLADIAAIVAMLAEIIREGVAARRFRPVNPLLVHGGIVGPVLLFFASDQLRKRIAKAGAANAASITHDEVVAHVHAVTLGVLRGKLS
jgi:TetR/AcrR family transcriptional regulator